MPRRGPSVLHTCSAIIPAASIATHARPKPSLQKDPVYGRLVRQAAAAGVRVLPVRVLLDAAAGVVRFGGMLPLDLDYKWRGDADW